MQFRNNQRTAGGVSNKNAEFNQIIYRKAGNCK